MSFKEEITSSANVSKKKEENNKLTSLGHPLNYAPCIVRIAKIMIAKKSTDVNMTLFCLFVFGKRFCCCPSIGCTYTRWTSPRVFFSIVSSIWSCIFTWAFLFCLASHFPCFSFGFRVHFMWNKTNKNCKLFYVIISSCSRKKKFNKN